MGTYKHKILEMISNCVIISLLCLAHTVHGSCLTGWVNMGGNLGCLKLIHGEFSWMEATNICYHLDDMFSHLAEVSTDDDVRRLKDLLSMDAVMVGGPPHNWCCQAMTSTWREPGPSYQGGQCLNQCSTLYTTGPPGLPVIDTTASYSTVSWAMLVIL